MPNADADAHPTRADLDAADARLRAAHADLERAAEDPAWRDADRTDLLTVSACGITLDASKQLLDATAVEALLALARAADVSGLRDQMFAGAAINATEGRAVRHMALRAAPDDTVFGDVIGDVVATRDRCLAFADAVRSGRIAAHAGQPFTDVVNLGIGGSDLGPCLVDQALGPSPSGPRAHFVSNVDPTHLADVLANCAPARTLFVVASKSFTTRETMMNARAARGWIVDALGEAAVADHFAAVSTNANGVRDFGISSERMFGFWDWVGGRYSLWSAIGLPVAIAHGADVFRDVLAGAREMDQHFQTAPLEANLPVTLGLVDHWNRAICGHQGLAIVPYAQRLQRLPAFLQQLEMESNGKSVTADGRPVAGDTSPIVWGEPGTNAQHAFFQMLHQGTTVVPSHFIVAANPGTAMPAAQAMHDTLLANCLAQTEALWRGENLEGARARLAAKGATADEIDRLAPHKVFAGGRPSVTLVLADLSARDIGALIALYEHKVFVQGALMGINSFDQWGVELGKILADDIAPLITGDGPAEGRDPSTVALAKTIRARRRA